MEKEIALGAVLPLPGEGREPAQQLAPPRPSSFVPVPFSLSGSPQRSKAPLTKLISDDRAISRLLERLLSSAGLTSSQAAKELGITNASLRQYLNGRRSRPSLSWFLRFADLCGATVMVELKK